MTGSGTTLPVRASPAAAQDLQKLRDALIVLAGHLPLFSRNPEKRARALRHDQLRDDALDALDRLCDLLERAEAAAGRGRGEPAVTAEQEIAQLKHALSACIPWLASSGRGLAQEALARACELIGVDPFDWSAHPDVLAQRRPDLDRRGK